MRSLGTGRGRASARAILEYGTSAGLEEGGGRECEGFEYGGVGARFAGEGGGEVGGHGKEEGIGKGDTEKL